MAICISFIRAIFSLCNTATICNNRNSCGKGTINEQISTMIRCVKSAVRESKKVGDCDLAEATRRVGDRLAFIGGFDQNKGFEHGSPETVRQMVRKLFESCPNGGYICSPSDHFFFGDPENLQAFVDACRECTY